MKAAALNITLALTIIAVQAASAPTYDYVAVGGGTAGLTDVTVEVLEAGFNAERLQEVFVPCLIGTGISYTTLD
ncbi:hypothetical protein C8R45DRAFT_1101760 [Mycena sanguinolenta]|nr:hypothetical protein C8R45DRAFT_1101760 [Mycena sanguinolenta]